MTWHRPYPPRRGPVPRGATVFRLKVKSHAPPEGAHPFPELAPIVERRIRALELAAAQSPAALNTCWTQRTILRRALADLPPVPVPADVKSWMDALVTRWGCSVRTANKYRDTLSAAYEFDRLRGGQLNNPCADVKRLRASDPLKPALSSPREGLSAVQVYERARAAMHSERERAALGLWYVLGLRRSEVCGLEKHHFEGMAAPFDQAAVRLVQQRKPSSRDNEPEPLKTEKRRVLPLPPELAREIYGFLGKQVWVPPSRRGANQYEPPIRVRWLFPFNTDDLQAIHEAIRSVSPEALPPGRGVHELRHAFAEAALGYYRGDLREVGKRMGHSSEAVTAAYARGRYGTYEIRRDPGLFGALLASTQNTVAGANPLNSAGADFPEAKIDPSAGAKVPDAPAATEEKGGTDSRTRKVRPKRTRKPNRKPK